MNTISEISTYGLYAVRAKKDGTLFMPKGNEGEEVDSSVPYLGSTISIADLLEGVKVLNLANEVFSKDVATKLGAQRHTGELSSNLRFALPYSAPTSESVTTKVEQAYKPKLKDKAFTGWTAIQIAATNAQAGLEKVGKMLGVDNIEALVQAARSATNQADEMLVGNQWRIGLDDKKVYQGEGLEKILNPIKSKGEEYLYKHNYEN